MSKNLMMLYNQVKIGSQTIILGDCLEVMKTFQDKSIDGIVTSPPYNLGIQYNTYNDNHDYQKYLDWIFEVFKECERILKDEGSTYKGGVLSQAPH